VFSDYLDLIVDRAHRDDAVAAIAGWLAAQDFWDELAISCTRRDSAADLLIRTHLRGLYVREVDPLCSWSAKLPDRFEDYVQRLRSDVRRKLFNHRGRLHDPRIEHADAGQIDAYLALLGQYTADRWGGRAGGSEFQVFHQEFATRMAAVGRLRLSRLVTRDGTVSVMYSIAAGGSVYYLQSGFDAARSGGLSMGYLHFGFAIEAACGEGAAYFDFLAGSGRHRDYKQELLTEPVAVVTYHAVRGTLSRALYATYDALKRVVGR
jgi:hypothetical protein